MVHQVAELQQQVAEFEEELSESTKSLTELRRAVSISSVHAPECDCPATAHSSANQGAGTCTSLRHRTRRAPVES